MAARLPADDATLAGIARVLDNVVNPEPTARAEAEKHILSAMNMPGFAVCLLKIVSHASVGPDIRHQAAIQFKNLVRSKWGDSEDTVAGAVPEEDRKLVRSHIVDLMLSTDAGVRDQLSAAVATISRVDFPHHWPELLPSLAKHASAGDPGIIIGVLESATAVFERFDGAYECDEVNFALKTALEGFVEPFHAIVGTLVAGVGPTLAGGTGTLPQLKQVIHGLDLAAQCFHHLCFPVLADAMNDRLAVTMPALMGLLKLESAPLDAEADMYSPGPLERAQASVCRVASLFADKHDEDFEPYFRDMVGAVWQLLTRISKTAGAVGAPRFDFLLARGIRFLSSAARRPMYKATFESESTLRSIVEHIVLPNMCLTAEDEEDFVEQPDQFVSRDMEGSDTESRRRSASELIKGLSYQFEGRVGAIVLAHVTEMVGKYNADKAGHWKQLEAASALVTALAIRSQTRAQGVTELSPVVGAMDFFTSCVHPILMEASTGAAGVNAQPMLKAAALRFLATFRNQFNAAQLAAVIDAATPFLAAESEVTSTYAAIVIEHAACVRGEPVTAAVGPVREAAAAGSATPVASEAAATAARVMNRSARGPPRLPRAELAGRLPAIVPLLLAQPHKLCDAAAAGRQDARHDSPYHLRCANRLFAGCREAAAPAAGPALASLTALLGKVVPDPCRPRLQRYLFESICAAARSAVAASGPSAADSLDAGLRDAFQAVLTNNITELLPYVIQTLALVVRMGAPDGVDVAAGALTGAAAGKASAGSSPLTPGAHALLTVATGEVTWADQGLVPALAAFVAACAFREPASVGAPDVLNAVCARIVAAVGRRATEGPALALFRALVTAMPASVIAPVLAPAVKAFVARLMRIAARGGVRFLRHLLPTLATIAGVHGGAALQAALDTGLAESGGANSFVSGVAAPQMNKVVGRAARQTCLVGWSRFLAESPTVCRDEAALGTLVTGLCKLAMASQDDTVSAEEAAAEEAAEAEVKADTGSSHGRIAQAAPALERSDGLACPDPVGTLTASLGAVSRAAPGALPAVLSKFEAAVATSLKQWCDAKGVAIA